MGNRGRNAKHGLMGLTCLLAALSAGAQEPVRVQLGASGELPRLSVFANSSGTVAEVRVVRGAKEFRVQEESCAGQWLAAGQSCRVDLRFTPLAPGARAAQVALLDADGHELGRAHVSGTGVGGQAVLLPGRVIVAQEAGPEPDDVANQKAEDAAGNVYVADAVHAAIRRIRAANGAVETILRTDDAAPQTLCRPADPALDAEGNLWFTDGCSGARQTMLANEARLTVAQEPVRQRLENHGNAPLQIVSLVASDGVELESEPGSCAVGSLAPGAGCVLTARLDSARVKTGTITIESRASAVGTRTQTVTLASGGASTSVAVAATPGTVGLNQAVDFTATVTTTASSGAPTGTISFYDGATVQGSKLLTSGVAMTGASTLSGGQMLVESQPYNTANLSFGHHAIWAAYDASGDPNHADSNSVAAPLTFDVFEATRIVLASGQGANSPTAGSPVNFTATVTDASSVVYGAVSFADGATTLCANVPLTASGTAACLWTKFSAGAHAIQASFTDAQDSLLLHSTSNIVNLQVQSAAGVALTSSNTNTTFGAPVTFTATVTSRTATAPTGTVVIFDGTQSLGTATLTTTATASNSTAWSLQTSTLTVGTHTITAQYGGDSQNVAMTSAALSEVIGVAPTTVAVSASMTPGISGVSDTLTATVALVAGSAPPTGSVTFLDGASPLGSAVLSNGAASLTAVFRNQGQSAVAHPLQAVYTPDSSNFSASTGTATLTVNLGKSQTTLQLPVPNPAEVETQVNLAAVVRSVGVTPYGTVTFFDSGAAIQSVPLAAQADGTMLATLAYSGFATAGSHALTAAYGGDNDNATSTSGSFTETVSAIATTTALTLGSGSGSNAEAVGVLVAQVTNGDGSTQALPSGTVVFRSGATTLGSATLDSTGLARLSLANLSDGTYSVVANYLGDAVHAASVSAAVQVTNSANGFTLTVNPATVKLATTEYKTVTVTLAADPGFTDAVKMSCASLPLYVSCTYATTSVALTPNATKNVSLTIDTNIPLTGGAQAHVIPSRGAPQILWAGLLGGVVLLLRLRRRGRRWLAMLLMGAALAALAPGCGSVTQFHAAPGTYTIQVVGTGTSTGITHQTDVTLVITP